MAAHHERLQEAVPAVNDVAERTTLSRTWIPVGQMLLLAAVYFVAAKLSLQLAIPPGYATAVWPPSGIALAALLLWGTRLWPGIWLGAALINFTIEGSPLLAVLIATGNTLEAVVGGTLIRHFTGTRGYFESGEDVVKFVALTALSATIAAAVGVTSLSLLKALPWSAFVVNAWTWWQGDTTGMILVTPLIASWVVGAWTRWSPPKAIEVASLLTAVALVTLIIFGGMPGDAASLPLAFIALPFVIWAAIRFGQREVTTVTAIVCAIARATSDSSSASRRGRWSSKSPTRRSAPS
jgi:integral membrane sensor domain MASE1